MSTQGELFRAHTHHQATQGELFRAKDALRWDGETNDTSATTDTGQRETTITNASEKRTKNTHFSPAKAMPVSAEARPVPAKAIAVSIPHRHK